MCFDILCPGDWQDSYESRSLSEGSWHVEVRSFADVMNVCKTYFSSKCGIADQNLFHDFSLYLDGSLFGTYSHGEITIFPPSEVVHKEGKMYIKYKYGRTGYIVNIEKALTFGLKKATRIDDKHVW